jgi:hypothetical protein
LYIDEEEEQEFEFSNTFILKTQFHKQLVTIYIQKYFSYFEAVSFIGGGNRRTRRTPMTC